MVCVFIVLDFVVGFMIWVRLFFFSRIVCVFLVSCWVSVFGRLMVKVCGKIYILLVLLIFVVKVVIVLCNRLI